MSNSRRIRRQISGAGTASRYSVAVRDLSEDEVEAAIAATTTLTDTAVHALWNDDSTDLTGLVNGALRDIAGQFGAGYLAALITSAETVASHALSHFDDLEGIDGFLEPTPTLQWPGRLEAVKRLAEAIIAEAVGMPDRVLPVLEDLGGDVGPVVSGVWQAFVGLGGEIGVGAYWCAYDDEDEDGLSDVLEGLADVSGLVCAAVELSRTNKAHLARGVIESVVADVLQDEFDMCLDLLEAAPDTNTDRIVAAHTALTGDDSAVVDLLTARCHRISQTLTGEDAATILETRVGRPKLGATDHDDDLW